MKNRRRKKKKSLLKKIFIFLLIVAVAAVALIGARYFINRQKVVKLDEIEMPDWIKSEIIEVDGTSRSGEKAKFRKGYCGSLCWQSGKYGRTK